MRILIVAATAMEVAPVTDGLRLIGASGPRLVLCSYGDHNVDVLTSGVGMVATAAWCSRALAVTKYDLALNLGVCGTFDPNLRLGSVVHVVSDRLVELGAEDGDAFLPIDQLGLDGQWEWNNPSPPANPALQSLPAVRGITVNTVHGRESSIAETVRLFSPQVESMEGAAFMCACSLAHVPFAAVRAVSNAVARRDTGSWKMAEAIENLGRTAFNVLQHA